MAIDAKLRFARLVVVAVGGIALMFVTGVPILIAQKQKISVDEVAEGLTCECGCGLTIANCNHPNCSFSVPAKDEIEAMINRGLGRDAIIGAFRVKYGEKILSAPTTQGFNLLAWITPFVMLLGGAILIVLVLGHWRARDNSEPTLTASVTPPSAAEAELRRQLACDLRDRT